MSGREAHGGGEGRIRAARFPARKSLAEFDFDHARGLNTTSSPTWAPRISLPAKRTWCSAAERLLSAPPANKGSLSGLKLTISIAFESAVRRLNAMDGHQARASEVLPAHFAARRTSPHPYLVACSFLTRSTDPTSPYGMIGHIAIMHRKYPTLAARCPAGAERMGTQSEARSAWVDADGGP